jgi:hypothetical protein
MILIKFDGETVRANRILWARIVQNARALGDASPTLSSNIASPWPHATPCTSRNTGIGSGGLRTIANLATFPALLSFKSSIGYGRTPLLDAHFAIDRTAAAVPLWRSVAL